MSNAARADFNDGVIAYVMNDYEKAFTTMQSLAETSDHGYAQYYMGVMYSKCPKFIHKYTFFDIYNSSTTWNNPAFLLTNDIDNAIN